MAYPRWTLDDNAGHVYSFEVNPNRMTSPFSDILVTATATTAPDGAILLTEGNRQPKEWTFSGMLLSAAQYDEFVGWLHKKTRVYLFDHFGRRMTIFITGFAPSPRRVTARHEYEMHALVLAEPITPPGAVWEEL